MDNFAEIVDVSELKFVWEVFELLNFVFYKDKKSMVMGF